MILGICEGFRNRHSLARLLETGYRFSSVCDISPGKMKKQGISVLALDFDGVLASHGALCPSPPVLEWLYGCIGVFGADRVFILSNKPTPEREEWFSSNMTGVRFVSGVRKKPFTDGIELIARESGVSAASVLMVDDRLLTGCLCAIRAGAIPCYISRPYISMRSSPFKEGVFILIRIAERLYTAAAGFL